MQLDNDDWRGEHLIRVDPSLKRKKPDPLEAKKREKRAIEMAKRRKKVAALHAKGKTTRQIGVALKFPAHIINWDLRSLNLPPIKPKAGKAS